MFLNFTLSFYGPYFNPYLMGCPDAFGYGYGGGRRRRGGYHDDYYEDDERKEPSSKSNEKDKKELEPKKDEEKRPDKEEYHRRGPSRDDYHRRRPCRDDYHRRGPGRGGFGFFDLIHSAISSPAFVHNGDINNGDVTYNTQNNHHKYETNIKNVYSPKKTIINKKK